MRLLPRTPTDWLREQREPSGAEGLWRIDDELYDLSAFCSKHPGGTEFIELTRGTDITAYLEVFHADVDALRARVLPKYRMRSATTPNIVSGLDKGTKLAYSAH